MAMLNKAILWQYGRRKQDFSPNIWLGGAGGTITSVEELADLTTADVNNFKNFAIDQYDNVSFFAKENFGWKQSVLSANTNPVTFYFDAYNIANDFSGDGSNRSGQNFLASQDLKTINLTTTTTTTTGVLRYSLVRKIYWPALESGRANYVMQDMTNLERIYIPKLLDMSKSQDSSRWWVRIKKNAVFYVHKDYETLGHPNYVIAVNWLISNREATIVKVMNYIAPSSISNLSVSNITTASVDVNFTIPASTNDIDFFEVWLEEINAEKPEERFYPRLQEITATGQTITGLESGKTYKLRLATCDIYWNGSGMSDTPAFSNEVIFTTL